MPAGQLYLASKRNESKPRRRRRARTTTLVRTAHPSTFSKIAKYSSFGLPKAIYTKLNYCLFLQQTCTSGSIHSRALSLNNMHDIDQGGSGAPTPAIITRQPYMYDQIAPLYNKYVVYGVKFKIWCSSDSANDVLTTFRPAMSSATIGDMALEIERGAYKKVWNLESPALLKGYINIASQMGNIKKNIINDDVYQATVGVATSTSPIRKIFGLLGTVPADAAATVTANYKIQLKYYVKFFQYSDQGSS